MMVMIKTLGGKEYETFEIVKGTTFSVKQFRNTIAQHEKEEYCLYVNQTIVAVYDNELEALKDLEVLTSGLHNTSKDHPLVKFIPSIYLTKPKEESDEKEDAK